MGKYQAHGIRPMLEEIAAHFLVRQGLEVSLGKQTAQSTGITGYGALTRPTNGPATATIAVVVAATAPCSASRASWRATAAAGGHQPGRLGFITDVSIGQFARRSRR